MCIRDRQEPAQILRREGSAACRRAARQQHGLEGLAHFTGQQELARLAGPPRLDERVALQGELRLDAGAEQKGSLRAVAGHFQPRRAGRFGEPGEIDPGGNVLQSGVAQRIAVRAVAEVAVEGPVGALGQVVLRARQPVVEQQRRAARERLVLAAQAKRLLLPGEMGEAFKAIALTRDLACAPAAFALQDLRRSL